jgi:hypothetical protein
MIKLFLKEYLDEMSTVCRDNQNNVSIAVNPNSERQGHPYFKFYNNVYYGDAAKVVRILFNSADYVDNKNAEDQKSYVSYMKSFVFNAPLRSSHAVGSCCIA